MAANLSRLRFNAAAAERRTGRTLEGCVCGKTGLESGEYLRGDAVAHVMLEYGTPTGCFAAGICVEAFKGEVRQREYPWIGDGISIAALPVRDSEAAVLPGRRFRDTVQAMGASSFESKRDYNDQRTFRLGVHRRNVEFNSCLDALLRSVSFTPLTSIDAFVCDCILEDRPVDISLMKENLASYKEVEREADDTVHKIEALGRASSLGEEWRSTGRAIELQEYLRLRVDTERAKESVQRHGARVRELSREIESREHASERLAADLLTRESLRRDLETAIARDDSFLLPRSLREKKAVVDLALEKARQKQSRWEILRSQCATLLKKPLGSKRKIRMWKPRSTAVKPRRRLSPAQMQPPGLSPMRRNDFWRMPVRNSPVLRVAPLDTLWNPPGSGTSCSAAASWPGFLPTLWKVVINHGKTPSRAGWIHSDSRFWWNRRNSRMHWHCMTPCPVKLPGSICRILAG